MRILISRIAVSCILFLPLIGQAQTPANPIIKNYGTIYAIDNVEPQDSELDYKIVIDLKSSNDNYDKVNSGLNNVARMLNLHGVAGVPGYKLKVAVAVHYTATPIILNNTGYQKKYGVDNPNLELINELKEAGVELFVCGQSLVARKYAFEDVNPQVETALSMLTVVTEKTMNGYQLLVFQ
jgi:intracellular sulfur oxidation DsrE/DsrF family protein